MPTIQEKAEKLYESLEVATRDDGTTYWCRKDESPDWVEDVCFKAHGDMMPDDWRYDTIAECAEQLAEGRDPDDVRCELEADPYYGSLNAWLASDNRRGAYVDEAVEELGHSEGIHGDIALGQIFEKEETLSLLVAALEDVELDED